jgi:hypothetical protein
MMDELLYVLPALACPVGMGAMMWLMMRGGGNKAVNLGGAQPDPRAQELDMLRSQVADLRARVEEPRDAVPAETAR